MADYKVKDGDTNLERPEDTQVEAEQTTSRNQMVGFYQKAIEARREYEQGWLDITEKYIESFEGDSRDSDDFTVKSKLIFQAHNLIVRRMQIPGRKYESDAAPARSTQIIRDGVSTVQDIGGFIEAMTADWAVYHRQVLTGNAPLLISSTGEKDNPVMYQPLNLFGCYFDPFALTMRTRNGRNEVKEFLYIEQMSYDEAKQRFPDKSFVGGSLPVGSSWDRNEAYTDDQIQEMESRVCEVGHYFNIQAKEPIYEVFVGSQAISVLRKSGEEYGYQIGKKDIIPVVPFKMFSSPKGFYGYGLQILYDLCIVQERLRNMAFTHMGRNVDAISILNVARGNAGAFMNQLYNARELQKANEYSVILNETGDQGGMARMESLTSDPLTSEYERMQNELTLEVKRCGFPIDEVDRPVTETATATKAELGATTQFVQQIQEINRDNYKDIELITMDIIKKTAKGSTLPIITKLKNNEGMPINSPEASMGENGEKLEPITLGDVADALSEYNITVSIDARSGAYKTDTERKMALSEAIQVTGGQSQDILSQYLELIGVEASDMGGQAKAPEEQAVGQNLGVAEMI